MTVSAPVEPHAERAAELRRGDSRVRVALVPGAPITSFVHGGVEWCSGGPWQDYAPTLRACALPTFVAGAAGARFGDGGTFAADEAQVDVRAHGDTAEIVVAWQPAGYALAWTRVVSLDADGALRVRYTVTNVQRAPLPFVWGLPLSLSWSQDVLIALPRGSRSRVAASSGDGLPAPGAEFLWPSLRDGGRLVDLSRPAALGAARAVLCYVELPRGRISIRGRSQGLEIGGEPGLLTHARVWVDHGHGAARYRWWRRRRPAPVLCIGPTIGAPDHLSEAVGAWRAARWVEPNATMTWHITIRAFESEQ